MPGAGPFDGAGDLGALVDAGDDRTAGGEDRVELRRHARPGQAGSQGHDVHVGGGEHLGQALGGLHVDEAHVARSAAAVSSSGRAAPPPLTTNTTSGRVIANERAASSTRSSDWEKPTLPAYMTTFLPISP